MGPLNKYGEWVAIRCKNSGWWANDPCMPEMCPEPEPKPEKPDKPNKPKPEGPKCKQSRLPNVKNGYWQCNKAQACTLYCENGNKTTHKLVCKYGDWFQKNGNGNGKCPKGGKPIASPISRSQNHNLKTHGSRTRAAKRMPCQVEQAAS